jgi:hypothetical protein
MEWLFQGHRAEKLWSWDLNPLCSKSSTPPVILEHALGSPSGRRIESNGGYDQQNMGLGWVCHFASLCGLTRLINT